MYVISHEIYLSYLKLISNRDSSKDSQENDPEIKNTNYNKKMLISTHSKSSRRQKRYLFFVCMYLKANNFIEQIL